MSGESDYSIRYPRRVLLRRALRPLGRLALRLLTRTEVQGRANLPARGPLILVGNHVALMEVVLMVLLTPWEIEVIGTGDIPMDPRYAWIVRLWGFLPVDRGNARRHEMRLPLDILRQRGVVGIFPEGGIWSPVLKRAHTGVAWLSYHSGAPVLPIGFGGMEGALGAVLALKRPRLTMNIGQPLPPVRVDLPGLSRKQALGAAATHIMDQIAALIPEAERRASQRIQDEHFDCILELGADEDSLQAADLEHAAGPGRFFHTPVLLDVMTRNMRLPVQALLQVGRPQATAELQTALEHALAFLDDHPHFLSYRFGYADAAEMDAGLRQLQLRLSQAARHERLARLRPLRRYRLSGTAGWRVEEPGDRHRL
ncbi:MAG: lysophospholipid acyltransferase family protein [Anaerolineaceae bacterium]|nr:lysophospholipid acyltransferase family protein [Anaerolineaceae bacterium]